MHLWHEPGTSHFISLDGKEVERVNINTDIVSATSVPCFHPVGPLFTLAVTIFHSSNQLQTGLTWWTLASAVPGVSFLFSVSVGLLLHLRVGHLKEFA